MKQTICLVARDSWFSRIYISQPHTSSISYSVFVNTVQATTVTEESAKETVEEGTTPAAVAVPIMIFIIAVIIAVNVVINVYVDRRRRYIPLL